MQSLTPDTTAMLWAATKLQLNWVVNHFGLISAGLVGIWRFHKSVKKFFTDQLNTAILDGVQPMRSQMDAHEQKDVDRERATADHIVALKEKNGERFDSINARIDKLVAAFDRMGDRIAPSPHSGD